MDKTMNCDEPKRPPGGWPEDDPDVCVCGHHGDYHPGDWRSAGELNPCSHTDCPCTDFQSQTETGETRHEGET